MKIITKPTHRRGSGLARTLVVSSATLAILLVCFSIYQYSQDDAIADVTATDPPMPYTPKEPERYRRGEVTADAPGMALGKHGVIGAGERARITIYGREGTDAKIELTVAAWTPVRDATNQFLLTQPDVRMRTNDGHAVRITAQRGQMEGKRQGSGSVVPQRGRLEGGVTIQYDRLTETQRAALPQAQRDTLDPNDLIVITMEEIEFDLEYSKLLIPGKLTLKGVDIELLASDLDIRFNDAENRVESLRINSGGSIRLETAESRLNLSRADAADDQEQMTLVNWLRNTLQESLKGTDAIQTQEPQEELTPKDELAYTESGVPIFRPDDDHSGDKNLSPVKYHARFVGKVDAKQMIGGKTIAHLEADSLEILRDLGQQADAINTPQAKADKDKSSDTPDAQAGSGSPPTTVLVTWEERLVIEVCLPDDPFCQGDITARFQASGMPARLTHAEGETVGIKLVYEPENGKASIYGTSEVPAVVSSSVQGTLMGRAIHTERTDEKILVRVIGPGKLTRAEDQNESDPDDDQQNKPFATQLDTASVITFEDQLNIIGKWVTQTRLVRGGFIARQRRAQFDRAEFSGQVSLNHNDTSLNADTLTAFFTTRRKFWGKREQVIQRIKGLGHVVMSQGLDRVTCREIDIEMISDADKRVIPRVAIAQGDVVAVQGGRTIKARDKLVVNFAEFEVARSPFSASKAFAVTVNTGLNVTEIDWTKQRRDYEAKTKTVLGVSHLQAFGDVSIHDTVQSVDITAQQLDAVIGKNQELETAKLIGTAKNPATVRMDTFNVTGEVIDLNVRDQWVDVPGAGRLAFKSKKDLDGRRMEKTVPIVITWAKWMKFRGRENRSVFEGSVHAVSESTTTFDCDRLMVEFDDVAQSADHKHTRDWWIFEDLIAGLRDRSSSKGSGSTAMKFSKEPAYLLATGSAVVTTSEFDEITGALKSRSRIAGPQLSVNLRNDVSKMMIEGAGTLLIEDYREPQATQQASLLNPDTTPAPTALAGLTAANQEAAPLDTGSLFSMDASSGPSVTLIEWDELMWYDFGVRQTRFTGHVNLKHFSGSHLDKVRGTVLSSSAQTPTGRSTFLSSHELTLDFHGGPSSLRRNRGRKMGGMSTDRIKQFQAEGDVVLQDEGEGLSVIADRIVYWKDRHGLAIFGSPQRRAEIVVQKPNTLPRQASVERLFYNLETGEIEISGIAVKSR